MARTPRLVLITAALVGVASLLVPDLAQAAAPNATSSGSPHIVARPDSVMVNNTTKLTGKHFTASKRITIEECAQSTWVVTANPCDSSNAIKVKTNPHGKFEAVFRVHTCATTTAPGFAETCYIGEPTPSGVDTITLQGAVTITVTGP